jgi:SAM-dependent methyltransferase
MLDPHYVNPKLVELYDLACGWSTDRDFYLSLAGPSRQRILDLGCGTGLLCEAYAARNHDVTGVDPAASMLDVARRKPHGKNVEWVQSSAQTYRSEKRFDIAIMTGHAFQVLLSDDDVLATFTTMRLHLSPDGFTAFESRNPAIDWKGKWDYDIDLESRGNLVRMTSRFRAMKDDRLSFELRYKFPDETLVSPSVLRFLSRRDIEERLVASGLQLENVFGNWDAQPFEEGSSREMIFIARAE